ncbi:hypothetical protein EDB92DRAFT_1125088 [Lactarius akahatsu]|uniref:F-box domain-containing protein n=1 Tax=Lactarius akahatsu TaxID=416441 RepID=A0AAD4Q8U4_9AGAM|nr:hypothetical protein EDB92DRAFT_1125088 [Lactarius akahatsu]
MRRRTLTSLPEELLVKIMEVGDGRSILACSNTCQTLRNVITNSSNLEYQLVLVSTGMRDSTGKDSPLLQIDRLRLLEKHEFSWRNLRWSESAAIPLLIGWQGPIAVSGDVLVFRRPHREAGDICIDALQDLLIYQCPDSSLRVRKLSTGKPHPAVSHEGTVFPPDGWRSHPDSPRVCGPHVAVTSDQGLYISAWDWKSGAHVSEFLATAQQPSFEFLDENHIVFPGSDDRQLCVYNIQDFPSFRIKPSAIEQVRCCQVTIPPCGRPGLPKRIHFKCNTLSTDVMEPDGGRRGGRIRQASRGSGVACGAGLAADEGNVSHTVAVKNARPAQRYFES